MELKNWNLSEKSISGNPVRAGGVVWVSDEVIAVAKESEDVIIVEGILAFYKLEPPWRIK